MNKTKIVSLLLSSLFIAALLVGASTASASFKRDANTAIKMLEKNEERITITINANNALVPELKSTSNCSRKIVTVSPGWIYNDNPSKAEMEQTNGAFFFAYSAAVGKTVVDTLQAGYAAEGSLRQASKYYVQNGLVKNALLGHANIIKDVRSIGQKNSDVCAILAAWQNAGYKGIYNLVNASWGNNALQNYIKAAQASGKKVQKAAAKAFRKNMSNASGFYQEAYRRAYEAFLNEDWFEGPSEKQSRMKKMLG